MYKSIKELSKQSSSRQKSQAGNEIKNKNNISEIISSNVCETEKEKKIINSYRNRKELKNQKNYNNLNDKGIFKLKFLIIIWFILIKN